MAGSPYRSAGWHRQAESGTYSGPPAHMSFMPLTELVSGLGRMFKFPQASSFKGAVDLPFGASFGVGSTAGMKMGMQADITFNPTIFMIQRGLREATSSKYVGRPLWDAIDRVLIPSIKQNFDKEGRPQKWKPLRIGTMIMRARQGWPQEGPILQRTKMLKNTALARARWTVDPVKGQALYGKFPPRAWYANIHQGGYAGFLASPVAGAQPIQPRPFAVIQEQDMDDIEKIFRAWLSKKMEKNIPKARYGA